MTTAIAEKPKKMLAKKLDNLPLNEHVTKVLSAYFEQLDGEQPQNLYALAMQEAEEPLLKAIMAHTNNNQFKAAKALGLNRGTYRKKLAFYGMM